MKLLMENKCTQSMPKIESIIFIKKTDCKIKNGELKLKRKYGKNKREIIKTEYKNV